MDSDGLHDRHAFCCPGTFLSLAPCFIISLLSFISTSTTIRYLPHLYPFFHSRVGYSSLYSLYTYFFLSFTSFSFSLSISIYISFSPLSYFSLLLSPCPPSLSLLLALPIRFSLVLSLFFFVCRIQAAIVYIPRDDPGPLELLQISHAPLRWAFPQTKPLRIFED